MNLKGRNKITPEFSMSSMTDIVFLLLIFFMIASTLAKELNTIDIKINVPPFIESGEKIVIDTRTLEYVKRVN